MNKIGEQTRYQGKLKEADPFYRRALEGYERTLGRPNRNTRVRFC